MRLFVAVELNEQVKARLRAVQKELSRFDRVVRWARPEQMHLTLKFLGDVPDDRVEAVCQAAGAVAALTPPVEVALGRPGCFPPRGRVRIVQVGVEEDGSGGILRQCNGLCEDAFADLGFDRERRPYAPHLTIGRVKDDATGGRLRTGVEGVSAPEAGQLVDCLYVVQSVLSPGGAQYTNVVRHEFTGTT